jgi:hypothetical protein
MCELGSRQPFVRAFIQTLRPRGMAAPIRAHPWDDDGPPAPIPGVGMAHEWEADHENDDEFGECEDEDPDPHTDPAAVTTEFVDMLIGLYMASAISGQMFTTLCYWAGVGGLRGDVPKFGLKPSTIPGHCTRHLNKLLGFEQLKHKGYCLEVPGRRKHDISRTKFNVEVIPPHESILAEIAEDPSVLIRLQEAKSTNDLPPSYTQHPIVLNNPNDDVLPMALYMDGLPYSQTDSVVGVWMINMISGMRHMIAVIRKRICCACGCRSFCTFHALYRFIHWSLSSLANKTHPLTRHDNTVWQERDCDRALVAGQPTRVRAALCQIKGDWAEFCSRFGFPNWASSTRPCFLCAAGPDEMYSVQGVSPISLPWHLNTPESYFTAVARCELVVTISAAQHHRLKTLLQYDNRQYGAGGLAVFGTQGLEELPLLVGAILSHKRSNNIVLSSRDGAIASITFIIFPCGLGSTGGGYQFCWPWPQPCSREQCCWYGCVSPGQARNQRQPLGCCRFL